ncbi:alanine racemase [Novymonas esmeraldas]|uniref:Pyridoxal phosphate homeostasis protein n=1 Tax=Novymonas esmeraldas TaxID=1808958 RepID=A0AAW0F0G7_9TRYP
MSRYNIPDEPTAATLAHNLAAVRGVVAQESGARPVTLVAVSKTKSPACLRHVYDAGQRIFGENYVQELEEKAKELPQDIVWHFIGHLQSNKVRDLLEGVPHLSVVQTIDSEKLASKVNEGCARYRDGRPLDVYLQVNTSGEESKSGTTPGAATVALAEYIVKACPLLRLRGFMTIGMLDYTSRPENFECLTRCRAEVAQALQTAPEDYELSMGMSGDYVNAIRMGATTVRVGSSIFGERYYPAKQGDVNA